MSSNEKDIKIVLFTIRYYLHIDGNVKLGD